jgi:hypothetical protein
MDLIPIDLVTHYNIGAVVLKGLKSCEKPIRIYVENEKDADEIVNVSQDKNLYFIRLDKMEDESGSASN